MVVLSASSDYSSIILLTLASLSVVSSASVVSSIFRDSKAGKSYHLQLVLRLLLSNLFLSTLFIIFFVLEMTLTLSNLRVACYIFLPLVLVFFVASFAWTVLLAVRFRRIYSLNKERSSSTGIPPIPFWTVWVSSIILALPTFLVSVTGLPATTIGSDDDSTPLVVAVGFNLYLYMRGLNSLKDVPFSVLSRRLLRAVGYIFVLLAVWIPNLVYNALCIADRTDTGHSDLQDVVVNLAASQGVLNVCVYVGTHDKVRVWLYQNLAVWRFLKMIGPPSLPSGSDEVSAASCAASAGPQPSIEVAKNPFSFEEEEDENDYYLYEEKQVRSSLEGEAGPRSISSALPRFFFRGSLFINEVDSSAATSKDNISNTAVNPMNNGQAHVPSQVPSTTSSYSSHNTTLRSILIDSSRGDRRVKGSLDASDFDEERFVRFGRTDVQVVSARNSLSISQDSQNGSIHWDDDLELSNFNRSSIDILKDGHYDNKGT